MFVYEKTQFVGKFRIFFKKSRFPVKLFYFPDKNTLVLYEINAEKF